MLEFIRNVALCCVWNLGIASAKVGAAMQRFAARAIHYYDEKTNYSDYNKEEP